jgi:hypothetical protein
MTMEEKLHRSAIRIIAPYMGFIGTGFLVYLTLGESLWMDESLSSLKHFLFWLPVSFLFMGAFMRISESEQNDRIQALETALAARDEKTTE